MWRIRRLGCFSYAVVMVAIGTVSLAAAEHGALADMPVREITVFKDGHAFLLHEGLLPVAAGGEVHLDYLPAPVMGTFWPFVADTNAKLISVSAGTRIVARTQRAISLPELLLANIGQQIIVHLEKDTYPATIVAIPERANKDSVGPTASGGRSSVVAPSDQVIELLTEEGTKVVPISTISDVTFVNPPKHDYIIDEPHPLLRLRLSGLQGDPPTQLRVGMAYLQKGIRWIPSYRIELDQGEAVVRLQATLLNELVDLENVTANLVIGVPSFDFKSTPDPIGLSHVAAQLSPYFADHSRTAYAFSNAVAAQTQIARSSEFGLDNSPAAVEAHAGEAFDGSEHGDDLFLFSVKNISLKKGERMVVPVGQWTLKYRDVLRLEVPILPPVEVRRNFTTHQQAQLAKLYHAPKTQHLIRLKNSSPVPMTTAPAMFLSEGRLLGQGMMTYTAPGSSSDLTITTAVNFAVVHEENETGRKPDAGRFAGQAYDRIDLEGAIHLTNHRRAPVYVEVTRTILGTIDEANKDAAIHRPGFRSVDYVGHPEWWNWYSWPAWWHELNGRGEANWRIDIPAGERASLTYKWHYFWRW